MVIKKLITQSLLQLILLFVIISCENERVKTINISVNHFLSDSLVEKSLFQLNIQRKNNCLIYTYIDNEVNVYSELKICDSVVYYNGIECKLLESNKYKIEGNEYEILTYLFDIKHSDDEELLLFLNRNYGLLIESGEHWDVSKEFGSDDITRHLALEIKNERVRILPKPTGF